MNTLEYVCERINDYPFVISFEIQNFDLDDDDLDIIIETLRQNTSIIELRFGTNSITDEGATRFLEFAKDMSSPLVKIDFYGRNLVSESTNSEIREKFEEKLQKKWPLFEEMTQEAADLFNLKRKFLEKIGECQNKIVVVNKQTWDLEEAKEIVGEITFEIQQFKNKCLRSPHALHYRSEIEDYFADLERSLSNSTNDQNQTLHSFR